MGSYFYFRKLFVLLNTLNLLKIIFLVYWYTKTSLTDASNTSCTPICYQLKAVDSGNIIFPCTYLICQELNDGCGASVRAYRAQYVPHASLWHSNLISPQQFITWLHDKAPPTSQNS